MNPADGGRLGAVLAASPAPVLATLVAVAVVAVLAYALGVAVGRRSAARLVTASVVAAEGEGRSPDALAAADLDGAVELLERVVADSRADVAAQRGAADLLRAALDGLPQGVLIVGPDGEVLERNAVGESFVAARHADALVEAAVVELVEAALEGRPERRELEQFGPPRRVLVVEVAPLATRVGPAAVAVIEDITERRRLEAVRRDFVANVSHELRTPVGAIGLLAETLLGEDDPEVAARLAGRIQDEAHRVGRTIEDLLELSRIETSTAPHSEAVPVAEVVAEAVARIHSAADHAGIAVDTSGVGPDAVVQGDRRQLTSALSNLLDNAVKYSDRGSSVEVAARPAAGSEIEVSVTDHGIGIPARDLERVFERFYRVDQGRSRETGGTGLGLAIVRHVAANHQGAVEVESRLGEGSTFTLRLPAPVAEPSTRSKEELVP